MIHVQINEDATYDLTQTDGQWQLASSETAVSIEVLPNGVISILRDGKSYTALVDTIDRDAKTVQLRINNRPYTVAIEEPLDRLLKSMGLDTAAGAKVEPVKAPMPGMILRILVAPGQDVQKGDGLLVLEAMKMENVLKATTSGTVKAVLAVEKTAVEKGTVLIEME
ncbi:MAG: acetyl-CoA carboxylase biotin carboxyl carrier protein subunit [Sphingobacteriales bacterium]|nr:MAG: acetyl-CoA carboxylase biotin carboxyl carrier protein subunit [Sphingobacteriales bacterium]